MYATFLKLIQKGINKYQHNVDQRAKGVEGQGMNLVNKIYAVHVVDCS